MGSNNQAQVVEIPFNRGLRQDLETVLMPQGGLADCNNVVFDKNSRLTRRGGFTALGTALYSSKTTAFVGPVLRTGTGPNNELLAFTDTDTFLYLPTEDKVISAGQDDAGAFPSTLRATIVKRFNVGSNQAMSIVWSDCASVQGHNSQTLICVLSAILDGSLHHVVLDVFEQGTYNRIYSGFTIANPGVQSAAPRLLAVGQVLFIFFANGTTGTIQVAKIDFSGANPVYTAPANIVTDGDAGNTFFDVAVTQGGFVIAYRNNTAGNRQNLVKTFNLSLTLVNSLTWTNSSAGFWSTPFISVTGATSINDRIYAMGFDPGNGKVEWLCAHFDLTTPLKTGTVVVGTTAALGVITKTTAGSPGGALAQWSENASTTRISDPRGHINNYFVLDIAGVLTVTQINQFSFYTPGSRIYRDATTNALFSLARFNDPSPSSPVQNAQNHLLLVDWGTGSTNSNSLEGTGTPLAHVASGVTPLSTESSSAALGGVCALSNGQFLVTSIVNLGTSSLYGQQVACYICQVEGNQRFLNTIAHNVTVVGGGTPLLYDGQRLVEMGFYSYPAVGAGNWATDTTGGSMLPGVYQYRFTWEWVDAKGQLHQSDASPALTVDLSNSSTTTNRVRFFVPCLVATRKQRQMQSGKVDLKASVRLVAYRTIAGGSTFHRVSGFGINVQSTTAGALTVNLTDVDIDSNLIQGTDTNSTVDTSVNKTLRVRTSSARSFTAINVTSAAGTSKSQIVKDLNTAFIGTLALTASVIGSNQIQILGTGDYLEVDTTANGSNLNTAVGFPAGGQVITGHAGSNQILYVDSTGANELPNQCPPPSIMHCSQGGRLWGLDVEYPERVWCTKTFVDGIAPSYSSALQVLIPGSMKLNGIAAQDDKVFAFGSLGSYIAAYGDGPDNTGVTGTFPSPSLVSVAANCDDPRGVVVGDDGVYFTGQDQAATTIYFMPRGAASPIGIGNRVRTLLSTTGVCRGAVYRQEKARMEFLFVDNDVTTTSHNLVYYHYKLKDEEQIGQFTRNQLALGAQPNSIGDWDTSGNNRHATVVGHSGLALQSDSSNTDPAGSAVAYMWQTGDIRPLGLVGYTQNYAAVLLATSQAADDFILTASYDSGVSFSEQHDFAVSETSGPVLRRWEAPTKQLPYGAVMFKCTQNLSDAGTVFHSLILEVTSMGGTTRLPIAKMA